MVGVADAGRGRPRPIRVLLVDDSLVARTVLARLLEGRPEFEIAGAAPTADQAIRFLSSHDIDIVVLDVEMPGKDGLTALPEILEASHGARVLIVSSAAEAGASATVRALTLGAADTLLKPTAGNFAGDSRTSSSTRCCASAMPTIRSSGPTARPPTLLPAPRRCRSSRCGRPGAAGSPAWRSARRPAGSMRCPLSCAGCRVTSGRRS
ncbi:response regulator [Rhizorhabdus histidinilytica]